MYLKSIDVQGFKSFANKMTFEFHNGITGIVGPNGSGKSNVADAVRWVLGEQSAKQLRGGNMQDVIFSGTEMRKPQGLAFVSITLDNSDHKLDVDFEEVTVSRRIYRSGESEYLLNGSACRLKDVNELFYDTGIGKEGYSIIGQGQIDRILSGRPEERRELFDEAAGIVKFKRRKNTALKKLEEEKQNLVRVTDILSELTRQLEPLEKQSEVARIYLRKKEELKKLDVSLFLLDAERIELQLRETEEKYGIADAQLRKSAQDFEQTKTEYEKLEHDMENLDEKVEGLREKTNQNALYRQQLEGQIDVLKEQIHAARLSDEHYQDRSRSLAEDLQKRTEEQETQQQDRKTLRESMEQIRAQQAEATRRMNEIMQRITETRQAVESGKNEIIELLNGRASTKGNLQRYDAMLEQIDIRRAQLNKRILSLKSEEAEQKSILDTVSGEAGTVKDRIDELTQQTAQMEKQVQEYQEKIASENQQMDVGQTAYHREASRLESLKNLTERYDGYGNSIRRVMEQKEKSPGICGVVADLIQVDKKYETAVETALGGSIQNIVTDNEQTAKQMIGYLKKNKYGRATFLPLTTVGRRNFTNEAAKKEAGVIGTADTLVRTSAAYEKIAAYLLGNILVVDHIDHAIAIAAKYRHSFRMVTLEGESLNAGGSMTGGAFRNTSNLLGRRREIEELTSSVGTLKKEMEVMLASIESDRKKRNELRDAIVRIGEQLQQQYIRQNTAKLNQKAAQEKLDDIQQGYGRLHKEGAEIEEQIRQIRGSHEAIQSELSASQKREQELETQIEQQQQFLDEATAQEEAQSKVLENIHLEYANLSQKDGFVEENVRRLSQEIRQLQEEEQKLRDNISQGSVEIEKKETDMQRIRETIDAGKQEAEETEGQIRILMDSRQQMARSHKSFFEKRDALSDEMNRLDKECFRLNNQKEKLEENQDTQVSYLWNEYELTPQAAKELCTDETEDGDRGAMKKQIGSIKEDIRKLGDVNVNAIEDYKNLSERHTFLENQYNDLVTSEKTLLGIIDELDTGMRRQFQEKFEEIRVEFDKVFKQLFGGGKGTLELMEDEDILEAGIRIISQPPGKKLQNMMQLSGGEKALTAIALLFAIQNLKPSPFCLLDEIEAALDDSNVDRFAQYLHKLTKNTQFIVITHRRGTMNAADRLYGITMQEKGVSTLVSVDLIDKELTH